MTSKHSEPESGTAGKYQRSRTSAGVAHGAAAISGLDPAVLSETLSAVLGVGDAISFAATRDGGAVVITMLSEGTVDKLYAATVEELQETLQGVLEAALSS